jgi:hypothetical protein
MEMAGLCDCGRMGFESVPDTGIVTADGTLHTPHGCTGTVSTVVDDPDKLPTPKDPGPAGGTLPRTDPRNARGLLELINQRMRQLQDEVWEVERHLDPVDLTEFDQERWDELVDVLGKQLNGMRRRIDDELTEQNRKIEALERTVEQLRWPRPTA